MKIIDINLLYRQGARCVAGLDVIQLRDFPSLLTSPFSSISSLSMTSFMCEWTVRPEEPTNLQLSESALMHGSACVTVSLKKLTHVPEEAWDVLLLLFTVCPCGMNKRCASWWAEQCQWGNQRGRFKKTWMASNGQARCHLSRGSRRRHYPAASYNDHYSSPIRPWSSGFISNCAREVPNAMRN